MQLHAAVGDSHSSSVVQHLAIAASSTVPCRRRSVDRAVDEAARDSISVFSSAIMKREFWNEPIGWPNALRSLMYVERHRRTRAPQPAIDDDGQRSGARARAATRAAGSPPLSPSRFSAGTRTSSKNSSAVS